MGDSPHEGAPGKARRRAATILDELRHPDAARVRDRLARPHEAAR